MPHASKRNSDEVNVEAAKVAREHDVPVLLDVEGKDTPIDPNLAPLVHIIWPNETELSICGGVPTDTDEDIFNAAKMLREQGMKDVLVTIGEKGSMMIPFDDPDNVTRGNCYRVDMSSIPLGLVIVFELLQHLDFVIIET